MSEVFDRYVEFRFDAVAPILIFGAVPHCSLRDFGVLVENAFDDAAAFLSVGTTMAPDLYIKGSDSILSVAGEYRISRTTVFYVSTDVYLWLSPAAASRGFGRLYFTQSEVDR